MTVCKKPLKRLNVLAVPPITSLKRGAKNMKTAQLIFVLLISLEFRSKVD